MDISVLIPARFESTRFPGKPLTMIAGKPMIEWVCDKCRHISNDIIVATDDKRIVDCCDKIGVRSCMTSSSCRTGTDRIYEAVNKLNIDTDIIVNVQGDEPLISSDDILKVVNTHIDGKEDICCGMCPIDNEEDFRNTSFPKVVCDLNNYAMYMSRAAVPTTKKLDFKYAMRQVCIYSFSRKALSVYNNSQKTPIENLEDIELFRLMENGYKVKMVMVSSSIAVDYPEDVKRVEGLLK